MSVSGKRKPSFSVDQDDPDNVDNNDDEDSFEASDLVGNLSASTASTSNNVESFLSTKNVVNSERTISSSSVSENDLDYESVSSPGNSSTASGPTYIRPAGFDHHAQDVLAPLLPPQTSAASKKLSTRSSLTRNRSGSVLSRHSYGGSSLSLSSIGSGGGAPHATPLESGGVKKKKSLLSADYKEAVTSLTTNNNNNKSKIEGIAISTRVKNKKEPLPMKQRALPQSFWQQPNLANPQPPGIIYSTLPPLPLNGEDASDMTPVEEVPSISSASYSSYSSQSGQVEAGNGSARRPEKFVTAANTDLLFSLFNTIEEEEAQRRIHIVRRGRPKKTTTCLPSTRVVRDDDPCLDSLATESILPLIPERMVNPSGMATTTNGQGTSTNSKGSQGTQVIRIMSILNGDRTVELPSLNVEHNYPHLLSELVMKL